MEPSYEVLREQLRAFDAIAVAFSGGVDSSFLLAAARDTVGAERVVALTAVTPYMVRQEIGDAIAVAAELGVRHELVEMSMPEGLESNPSDRCYRCKYAMYRLLQGRAAELGFRTLLDASNIDDAESARPGLQAMHELGIRAPLIACGMDKETVRALSRQLDLPTWRKPTNACLLTRLRYNVRVSMERLQQIEEAERFLSARGYSSVRVRSHDDLARIEVAPEQREQLLQDAEAITAGICELGFRYVALDLLGYQFGSMT